jgi:hypothetical protein
MFTKMSVKDWIAVKSNPIQRDTERRSLTAKHLYTPNPSHQFVMAAKQPNGNLIKLDGHTRALMWERKMVEAPPHVYVGLIDVSGPKEAEELYKTFDSKDALESVRDKTFGAFHKHNFQPESALLQRGHIFSALKMAYAILLGIAPSAGVWGTSKKFANADENGASYKVATAEIYDLVNMWSYELHALDAFHLPAGAINSGVLSAFLVSYRKYDTKVIPFWTGVFAKEGNKSGREMDAIQATVELIERRRGSKGGSAAADMTARVLGGVDKFIGKEVMTRVPQPLDLTDYLKGKERAKERLIKKADIKKPIEKALAQAEAA